MIDDHGDTVETATALAVGATAEGVIDIKGDLDVFTFDVAVGQRYRVAMDPVDMEWAELEVNDPDGSYVDQYWSDDLLEFVFVAEEAGTYSLEASGGFDSVGSYSVSVEEVGISTADDGVIA